MSHPNRKPPPSNRPSTLLSEYENEQLFNLLGKRCFTLATAVAQVFLAHPHSPKTWSKEYCGVVCFVKDNPKRSYFIRVYDIVKNRMVWETELYNQFKYQTPKQFYHVFATDECWAGLNFANDQEANNFKRVVTEKIQVKQQRKQDTFGRSNSRDEEKKRQAPNVPSHSRPNNSAPPPPAAVHHAPAPAAAVKGDSHNTNTAKKKEKKEKKSKDKKGKLTKADIGTPQDFKHVSHVGWDPEKGFDVDEMDPQVKDWFQTIGVSEDQLRDQNTAAFIKDFIDSHGGIDEIKKDVERMGPFPGQPGRDLPPPPPPSRGGQPPPPPPPARGSAAPPPPPAHVSRAVAPPPPPSRRSEAPPPPPSPHSHSRAAAPAPPPPSRGLPPPPPPAPSRPAAVAPPPPPPMGGGGGGPPPPPPPPPPQADFPAAPPPPPAPVMSGGGGGGRGDLLSQIQGGSKLKKVDPNEKKKAPTSGRGALLDQIQKGVGLKPVSPDDGGDDEPIPMDGIGMALLTALNKRQHAIQSDDDADSDEDDEFDDDEEWDD